MGEIKIPTGVVLTGCDDHDCCSGYDNAGLDNISVMSVNLEVKLTNCPTPPVEERCGTGWLGQAWKLLP